MSMAMDRITSIGKRFADGWRDPIVGPAPSERVCTEEEARQKWCPYAIQAHPIRACAVNRGDKITSVEPRCLASGCMAWRWQTEPNRAAQGLGFCGLAGEP